MAPLKATKQVLALSAIAAVAALAGCAPASQQRTTADVGTTASTSTPATAPTTSEPIADAALPAAVHDTFVSRVRAMAAVAGQLTTEYVQTRRGDATRALNIGQSMGADDSPVFVLFVQGTYRVLYDRPCGPDSDLSSIPRRCGLVDGSIIAVISADGSLFDGGDYGVTVPDLAALGAPSTTSVDFGPPVPVVATGGNA